MQRLLFLFLMAIVGLHLGAQETASQYLEGAHLLGTAPRLRIDAELKISTPQGTQERTIEVYLERAGSRTSLFTHIQSPPFLRNMKFLVNQDSQGNEEKWMRTSHGVRRISNTDRETMVFNSHFTAEDFSFVDPSELTLTLVEETPELVVIHAIHPTEREGYRRFTIDRSSHLVRSVEYFDSAGTLIREYRVLETLVQNGEVIPRLSEMNDLIGGGKTTVVFSQIETPGRIPSRVFNRGNL